MGIGSRHRDTAASAVTAKSVNFRDPAGQKSLGRRWGEGQQTSSNKDSEKMVEVDHSGGLRHIEGCLPVGC